MSEIINGKTGTVGVDGILDGEQSEKLNRLQTDAADTAFTAVNNRAPDGLFPLIGMATGIGKGNIIHRILEKQVRSKPDSKILVVAGTKITLVSQTHNALAEYQTSGGDYVAAEDDERDEEETMIPENDPLSEQRSFLYRTGTLGNDGVNVEIATIQKVVSAVRKGELDPDVYDLVVVDEVHNIGTPMRKNVIKRFDRVTGLTATAHRHSGKYKKPVEYGFEQVVSYTLPEAQEDRLLPPLVGIQIDTKDILDEVPTKPGGSIDYKELEKLLKQHPELRSYIADRLVPIIASPDGHKYKTVVAVNFVWEAQELAELLAAKGIKVGVAVNQQAAKQIHTEEIPALGTIEKYKLPETNSDAIQVLISPYVASEGFDAPFTEAMVWASPTDSPLRYTQYTGRLARRAPGKKFGIVVDCMYQTEQYGWSYNMGMWMKDYVTQLDNGMLYMGPVENIDGLSQLSSFVELGKASDKKTLAELQEGADYIMDRVQEGDIVLSHDGLGKVFIGERNKIFDTGVTIIDALRAEHPEWFTQRMGGNNKVSNIIIEAGRPDFVEEMASRGIKERPVGERIEQVNNTDIPITQKGIPGHFFGSNAFAVARAIHATSSIEHPEWFTTRMSGNRRVTVVTEAGVAAFTDLMLEQGVQIRDHEIETAKPTDFTLTQRGNLDKTFQGSVATRDGTIARAIGKVEEEHPEWFVERSRAEGKGSNIKVVPEEHVESFTAAMVAAGATLHIRDIEQVTETDFQLTGRMAKERYKGGTQRKVEAMKEVEKEFIETHPEWFKQKKGRRGIVQTILPEHIPAFDAEMAAKGVQLQ